MGYFPIAIELAGKDCLVVGGGEVALRKVTSLLSAGARITVIAPEVNAGIAASDRVTVHSREYEPGDVEGRFVVFAATDDRAVNEQVSRDAQERGMLINVVDDPELCTFIVPSVLRRGDLMIAVTTGGKSPSLSKKIRRDLEELIGEEYTAYVELLGLMRDTVKSTYTAAADREAAFKRLLGSGILELLRQGKSKEAREKAFKCI